MAGCSNLSISDGCGFWEARRACHQRRTWGRFEGEHCQKQPDIDAKLSNDLRDGVKDLFVTAALVDPRSTVRSAIALSLRQTRRWQRSVIWATTQSLLEAHCSPGEPAWTKLLDCYRSFVRRVFAEDLAGDLRKPHIIDGKRIQSLLKIKPSPIIHPILQAVLVWQFDNPRGTIEDCEAHITALWNSPQRAIWESATEKSARKR